MLERYIYLLHTIWDFLSGLWLKIFTYSSIPVIIFSLLTILLMGTLLYFNIKYGATRPRLRKVLGYAATTSFIFCIFSLGVANMGLPVDTLRKSVQIVPTGDYVIASVSGIDLGGVNMVMVPREDFRNTSDSSNTCWKTSRYVHLIPEQLDRFTPKAGMEITVANIKDSYRYFPRLTPLPGDEDEPLEASNASNDQTFGMVQNGQ